MYIKGLGCFGLIFCYQYLRKVVVSDSTATSSYWGYIVHTDTVCYAVLSLHSGTYQTKIPTLVLILYRLEYPCLKMKREVLEMVSTFGITQEIVTHSVFWVDPYNTS